MTIKKQIAFGATAGIAILLAVGGALRVVGLHVSSIDAASSAARASMKPAMADPGRRDAAAAIIAARDRAPVDVTERFGFMSTADESFAPSEIKSLRDGIYGGVRSDGTPCFYFRLRGNDGDGFCIRSFMDEDIATSAVVGRQYDSPTAPFDIFVNGVVRSGVAAVAFHLTDGRTVTSDVDRNVFTTRLADTNPGDVSAIELTYRSGVIKSLTEIGRFVPEHAPAGTR